MNLSSHFKHLEKLAIDNSPALLTAVGVLGTVTSAVLAARGHLKADLILAERVSQMQRRDPNFVMDRDWSVKEKVSLTWKCYVPTTVSLCLTVGAIVGSHRIGTRRTAAITSAYVVVQKGYEEYKDKVVETFGEAKEEKIRADIAQDRLNDHPISESNIVVSGTGDVLCYEMLTDRYFRSSFNAIKAAENETNHQILNDGYASLTDFYDRVGLKRTAQSEELGWRSDGELFAVKITGAVSDDGQPCLALDYKLQPVRDHYRFHGSADAVRRGVQV